MKPSLLIGFFVGALWVHLPDAGSQTLETLIQAKRNASVPIGVLREFDTRSIGEAIVKRISQSRTGRLGREVEYVNLPPRRAELHLYFHAEDLRSVLASGFLSYAEMGVSGGMADQDGRQWIDRELSQLNLTGGAWNSLTLDEKALALAPKFAGLSVPLPADVLARLNQVEVEFNERVVVTSASYNMGLDHLGDVIAVLKEAVKKRASYTPDDTYNNRSWVQNRQNIGTFSDRRLRVQAKALWHEAQIWGALDIRDVERFLVPSGIDQTTIELLKGSGLPIFEYEMVTDSKTLVTGAEVRRRLFVGNSKTIEALERSLKVSRTTWQRPEQLSALKAKPKLGRELQTPAGGRYVVEELVEEGVSRDLYKLRSGEQRFALKIRSDDSFGEYRERMFEGHHVFEALGIPSFRPIEWGKNYIIEEWIDGETAEVLLGEIQSTDLRWKQLIRLLGEPTLWIEYPDLVPRNLIWNGHEWVVADLDNWARETTLFQVITRRKTIHRVRGRCAEYLKWVGDS